MKIQLLVFFQALILISATEICFYEDHYDQSIKKISPTRCREECKYLGRHGIGSCQVNATDNQLWCNCEVISLFSDTVCFYRDNNTLNGTVKEISPSRCSDECSWLGRNGSGSCKKNTEDDKLWCICD